MSSVAQAIKPKVQRALTQQSSMALMKNLINASISSVAYLRNLFDEDSFLDCELNQLQIKKLKKGSSAEVDQLIQWIEEGVYEALEKKYLQTLVFGIYSNPTQPNSLLESFTFKFQYVPDGSNLSCGLELQHSGQKPGQMHSVNVKKDISAATINLFRTLIILNQTLKPLAKPCYLTMKLYYYPSTPQDFEPKCFRASNSSYFNFSQSPAQIDIGNVNTPFHQVSLTIHSLYGDSGDLPEEIGPLETKENDLCMRPSFNTNTAKRSPLKAENCSENEHESVKTQARNDRSLETTSKSHDRCVLNDYTIIPKATDSLKTQESKPRVGNTLGETKPGANGVAASIFPSMQASKIRKDVVDCICALSDTNDNMLQCIKCNSWSHATCIGVWDVSTVDITEFTCPFCTADDANNDKNLQRLAHMRRALHCYHKYYSNGTVKTVSDCLKTNRYATVKLIEELENLNLLRKLQASSPKNIRTFAVYLNNWELCLHNPSFFGKVFDYALKHPQTKSSNDKKRKVSEPSEPIYIAQ